MSQIHFGYVLFDEGTDNESVRVLVSASSAGLEAQAHLLGLRLRMEDYVTEYSDLEDYDVENIYMVEHKKCSDSKCIVAGAEYPCVEEAEFITVSATVTTDFCLNRNPDAIVKFACSCVSCVGPSQYVEDRTVHESGDYDYEGADTEDEVVE